MPSFNQVVLAGNLTRDPEVKNLPSGSQVVEFGLAVNAFQKGGQEQANFFDCVAFGKTAENIAKYFQKGRSILIQGELRQDRWKAQDGSNRSKVKVQVFRFEFMGEPKGQRGGEVAQTAQKTFDAAPIDESEIPF